MYNRSLTYVREATVFDSQLGTKRVGTWIGLYGNKTPRRFPQPSYKYIDKDVTKISHVGNILFMAFNRVLTDINFNC